MRAVIYCRVSTSEQTQNLSLATQDKACREYCARNGYAVDEVFIDAGESAKTTDRPEFLRLLEHCRRGRGRLHAVIVYSLTRFSRNSTDHHAIVGLLRGLGITLRSVTEPIDESPSGRLMEGILAAMAQFDNDTRSERVVAGMKAAVERGRWVWPAPLGYRNADARRGASLVPDPDRAPAVREAFEVCARGICGKALFARVTALGLRTKRGHPITLSRVYELLRNPVYAGWVRTPTWTRDVRGDFEPLISDEIFARAQVTLNRPARAEKAILRHVNHPDFPLRRFVRCATCGGQLTGSWSTGRNKQGYGFYHCRAGCQRVPKAQLETAFVELLDTLRPRPEYWKLLEVAVLDVWRDAKRLASATRGRLRRRVYELEARLTRLEEAFLHERTIDETSYRPQRDELREQIAVAKMEDAETMIEEMDVEGMLAFAEHTLQHAGALWTAAASVDRRIQLQWVMFPTGLTWSVETFLQPTSCLEFFHLDGFASAKNGMVDLTGIEPVTS